MANTVQNKLIIEFNKSCEAQEFIKQAELSLDNQTEATSLLMTYLPRPENINNPIDWNRKYWNTRSYETITKIDIAENIVSVMMKTEVNPATKIVDIIEKIYDATATLLYCEKSWGYVGFYTIKQDESYTLENITEEFSDIMDTTNLDLGDEKTYNSVIYARNKFFLYNTKYTMDEQPL